MQLSGGNTIIFILKLDIRYRECSASRTGRFISS